MNEILNIAYGFARAVWRRRWIAVVTTWAVAVVAWLLVLNMPDRYEASARVFVDARTALRPVLEGIAIETDYDSQLALVRETLLSRPQLEVVARDLNLNSTATTPGAVEAMVNALQKDIDIRSVSSGGESKNTLYTIAYQNTDREKSLKVVNTLLKNFEEGTLKGSRSGANEAQQFLDRQISELEARMQEAEERLAEFKKRNIGQIPGEKGDYFTRFDQEQAGLQQAETELAIAYGRRSELQRQLAGARAFLPGTSSGAGAPAGGTPDITQRRQEAEQKYEELLLRFTDRHPEAIALRQTIDDLKQREAKEMAELQRGGTGTGAIRSLSANPVYQQIQSQLNQIQVEIAASQSAADQHKREIANLRQFVNRAPEIEQEFARLNRDYGVIKQQYDQLVTRRQQARVSDDAANSGIVRFDVIDPPAAGLDPVAPKRKILFAVVLLLAIGAGVALSILPHLLAPTFDDVATIQRKLGLPVLGAISMAYSTEQRRIQRQQMVRVAFAGAILVLVAAVLVASGNAGARMLRVFIT